MSAPSDKSLSPEDRTLWRVFLFYHPGRFEVLGFQVPIDTKPAAPEGFTAKESGEWARLLAKRIDVIASRPGAIAIIEVKPHGGAHAMGQALLYATLFLKTTKPTVPIEPWVICDRVDADAIDLYRTLGVGLWQAIEAEPRVLARSLLP
jgi:hypothetical protein